MNTELAKTIFVSTLPMLVVLLSMLGTFIYGIYFQNKRLDDFKEGLYKYLDAEFSAIKDRLGKLEDHKLIK